MAGDVVVSSRGFYRQPVERLAAYRSEDPRGVW